jgi:hypothetical protein
MEASMLAVDTPEEGLGCHEQLIVELEHLLNNSRTRASTLPPSCLLLALLLGLHICG